MARITTIVALGVGFCLAAGCTTADLSSGREALLVLSYQEFDQTEGSGWRTLAEGGHRQYRQAARLIEAYLARHSGLPADQHVNLHFHAAQAFAFAGDITAALAQLEHAQKSALPCSPTMVIRLTMCWNAYVAATKAFLEHDRAALLAARECIARDPIVDNLQVVDRLIAHFGEPYAMAYREKR